MYSNELYIYLYCIYCIYLFYIFIFLYIWLMMTKARQHLFDKNTVKALILWNIYYNSKYRFSILMYLKMLFIPVMQRWIFSSITPVFSVTWSSKIIWICWFGVQETFIPLLRGKQFLQLLIFVKNIILPLLPFKKIEVKERKREKHIYKTYT